jgi:ABC-type hemin transport system ATPase subunit
MQILQDYAHARHFVVIAIHGLSRAPRYCDRLCLMNKGRRVQTDVIDEALNSETLSPVFNVDLDNLPLVVLAQ